MKKYWKRTLALCLAMLMLLGAAPLTVSAKANIPADAQKYKGHSYKVYDESRTWTEAKAYCERLGGHLVTITSAEEQSLISLMSYVCSKDLYWIGAYGGVSTGSWKWVTGEKWDYTNWSQANMPKPDNVEGNEDYVCIYRIMLNNNMPGTWNDEPNNGSATDDSYLIPKFGFICEWETTNKNVNSVSVDDITINYKQSATLRPEINADEGASYTVKYESLNPVAVTVDDYGNIYGAKTGVADIKVTVTDSNGKTVSDTCTVTVAYSTVQWIIVIFLFGWIWY